MPASIVQYFGEQNSRCGYCTGTNSSKSHGMHAYRLDCKDYQDLIDRGWRRCGIYCYKPQNETTCCPCYTIKCDASKFKLSKSHKRVLRRMKRFLRDGKRETKNQEDEKEEESSTNVHGEHNINMCEPQPQLPERKPTLIDVEQVASMVSVKQHQEEKSPLQSSSEQKPSKSELSLGSNPSGELALNPPRKKAKQMRLERRQAKLGISLSQEERPKICAQEKSLRDFLNSGSDTDKHKLKIVLVKSSDTQRTCTDEVHMLYRKYQLAIHNDNPARLTLASMQRFLVNSPFKLRLVNVHSEDFKRTLHESYELYKKYQIAIHNDPPTNCQGYQHHLQASPIKHEKPSDGPDQGYGSFHQQYWLDDKLIAVGVIDILPGSVSSVYFFYDPDYSFLSLGTYGSLREIDLVQTFATQVPELKYYYMGFYIHSCPKMRYKGKLSASYLLCPETYIWLELTNDICSKLDEHKYLRLCPDTDTRDANEFLIEDLDHVRLFLDPQTCITYKRRVELCGIESERNEIIEYGKLVGKICARRMIYVTMS